MGLEGSALSLVALFATKRNLPAESILKATGATGTVSDWFVSTPLTRTWIWTLALFRVYVVALPSLPSEAMGNARKPRDAAARHRRILVDDHVGVCACRIKNDSRVGNPGVGGPFTLLICVMDTVSPSRG